MLHMDRPSLNRIVDEECLKVLAASWHPDVRDPCKCSGLTGGGFLQLHSRIS